MAETEESAPAATVSEPAQSAAAESSTQAEDKETSAKDIVSLHCYCREFSKVSGHKIEQWLGKNAEVPIQSVFKILSWNYAFVKVLSADQEKFTEKINGLIYRKMTITVSAGHDRDDKNRRPREDQENSRAAKRQKIKDFPSGHAPTLKDLKDKMKYKDPATLVEKIAPLYEKYSYETQLSMKEVSVKSAVRAFTKLMTKRCEDMNLDPPPWTEFDWSKGAGAPLGCACPLDEIIGTPTESLEGYRNKCEFSIGKDLSGEKEVGFILRVTDDFGRIVGNAQDMPLVPKPMKQLCVVLKDAIKSCPYETFQRTKSEKSGVWRMVMARLSPTGDMLVMVQTTTLNDEDKAGVSKLLTETLVGANIGVVSIYLQFNDEVSDAARPGAPLHLIHGQKLLRMPLLGLNFDIGPLSFYQANSKTCELLYSKALDWLKPNDATAVLDICCGVGTIGLCASQRCRNVIGVELIPEAVESAKANAALNNVTTTEWRVGRAEEVLPGLLDELDPNLEVCAVVDPPRPGLHPTVLGALRNCSQLSRIVYVSCNPESLVEDVVKLTLPRETDENPFVPVRAVAVDMFPHTLHCEMILLLERSSKVEDPRPKAAAMLAAAQAAKAAKQAASAASDATSSKEGADVADSAGGKEASETADDAMGQ
eukprot:TRINITY_DN34205_c0_g1_i1.p1 TRINITY_DN34205_c0_g1~~TRINITY_DN34205_c0_g1_i1.p1  ORF type:complete len:661 (+),score=142.23 TRINITY_DN34205_c0_g1_i1:31-1983(+)